MKLGNLIIFLSMFLALAAIPLTLSAVMVSQDTRSQAMVEQKSLPTIPPLNPSPSPTPTPIK